ncbi:Organic cation/carnitine transporter 4 [Hibiscus syriacus]|uniref:Organic cation/carnitine transporter 4 n=1 Tax=Hibiscus syriacus TaxID=106335 RepID=A0A6A3AJM9_HIBSY|nr:Organic cation/carnitine transporter 4 [Hibiscus syriacus]
MANRPRESDPSSHGSSLASPLLVPSKEESGLGSEPKKLCIDDMLQAYCGEFGHWQRKHFVLTSLAWALEAFHTMVMIFADREPGWRAWEVRSRGVTRRWPVFVGWNQVRGNGKAAREAQRWLSGGWSVGRTPDYVTYLLLRFLTGFSTGGVGLCAFVLATEPVGPSRRGIAGMSTFYLFSGGIALLSGIAYVFPTWRALYVASSVPSILFLVLVIPFISESPRWYLVRGRTNEAMKIMPNDASSGNQSWKSAAVEKEAISGSVIDVIRSPVTRIRLFLAVGINFTCSVVYYGLSLNVVNLGTNLYLTVLVNAVAEMPAFAITAVLLDRFGRKPLAIGTQWFSAMFCFMGSMMGGVGIWKVTRVCCGILGIFGMAGTYNLLFIYTAELFPTVVRNVALGCATQAAQMGAILAPFVVVLGGGFPFMVFGVCGLIGGMLAYYLPETLNKPLYDTMTGLEEGELA